jgi:hypothetical protein
MSHRATYWNNDLRAKQVKGGWRSSLRDGSHW